MYRGIDRLFYIGVLTFVLALAAAGCGDSKEEAPADTADVNSQGLDVNGCELKSRPESKTVDLKKPTKKLDPKKTHTIEFQTNCGDFTIELDAKKNPKTAASVAHIAREGAYDGTWFHRIIADFVIQGGDPLGEGSGDVGYSIVEEPTGAYDLYSVAMAKAGNEPPGASSSQFYIVTGQQGIELPPEYAIAGKVVDGVDTVQRISGYAAADGQPPTGVAVIEKATLKSE